MYYEINIALNGKHFFATDERSITNKFDLNKIYSVLKQKFPKEEGYEITVYESEKHIKEIDMNKIKQEHE